MRNALLLAVLILGLSSPATAQTAENVFVVIIDGLRDDEGFESESLYLRHIWNDLRPQGTINTKFWNRGWTATTAGHTTILSGVRQFIENSGSNLQDVRSYDPLMYEYYRRQTGAPETECGTIVGKWGNVGRIAGFGLEPVLGEAWKGAQFDTAHDDTSASRITHDIMNTLHPRLVLINLR